MGTQREASAFALPLLSVAHLKLPTFQETTALQLCKLYGDEAVAPSYVRFTELLGSAFHCSVLRVLKLDLRQDVRDIGLIKR